MDNANPLHYCLLAVQITHPQYHKNSHVCGTVVLRPAPCPFILFFFCFCCCCLSILDIWVLFWFLLFLWSYSDSYFDSTSLHHSISFWPFHIGVASNQSLLGFSLPSGEEQHRFLQANPEIKLAGHNPYCFDSVVPCKNRCNPSGVSNINFFKQIQRSNTQDIIRFVLTL